MRPMLRSMLLMVSLLVTPFCLAETVYKYVDENGNTVFTDEPRKGAETLDVQPVPTVPAIPVPPPTKPAAKKEGFKYGKVVIVQPENQKNFINQVEPILVQVALSPSLRSGDQLQLVLNGAPKGSPVSGTQISVDSLDRGTYQASVKVLDKDGKEVGSSTSVEFYVKRNSMLMPKPAAKK